MTTFRLRLHPQLPAEQAWRRILNLNAHSDLIPLTRVSGSELTADELRPGTRFVARTTLGPFVLNDPMTIEEFLAPSTAADTLGFARIRKHGRVIGGWIELRVAPLSDQTSRVEWTQDLVVRGVPTVLGWMTAAVGAKAYRTMLRRLLAHTG